MVNIKLKILEKGKINPKQLINILQKHEDAIGSGSSTDTSQTSRIGALEEAIGSATGDNPSGLEHEVADLKDYISEIFSLNDDLVDPRAEP